MHRMHNLRVSVLVNFSSFKTPIPTSCSYSSIVFYVLFFFFFSGVDCNIGSYADDAITDVYECKDCLSGQYQDEESQASCKMCSENHITTANVGSTGCKKY